ncbi:MAG: lipid-A-disaccharide synthase N-terminal domain-containing protein [Planctomycetota bacterium]
MKWQLVAAMCALIALAVWLVMGEAAAERVELAPGARGVELRLGTGKGWLEVRDSTDGDRQFRVRFANEPSPPRVLTGDEFVQIFGRVPSDLVGEPAQNWLFRVFNITSWTGLAWVTLGFVGQMLFLARMLVQWLASEKEQRSIVPVGFWWLSLVGGAMLFAYFVWRRDIVGVLGQTTGVVVYARNLRLIYKRR